MIEYVEISYSEYSGEELVATFSEGKHLLNVFWIQALEIFHPHIKTIFLAYRYYVLDVQMSLKYGAKISIQFRDKSINSMYFDINKYIFCWVGHVIVQFRSI